MYINFIYFVQKTKTPTSVDVQEHAPTPTSLHTLPLIFTHSSLNYILQKKVLLCYHFFKLRYNHI